MRESNELPLGKLTIVYATHNIFVIAMETDESSIIWSRFLVRVRQIDPSGCVINV